MILIYLLNTMIIWLISFFEPIAPERNEQVESFWFVVPSLDDSFQRNDPSLNCITYTIIIIIIILYICIIVQIFRIRVIGDRYGVTVSNFTAIGFKFLSCINIVRFDLSRKITMDIDEPVECLTEDLNCQSTLEKLVHILS